MTNIFDSVSNWAKAREDSANPAHLLGQLAGVVAPNSPFANQVASVANFYSNLGTVNPMTLTPFGQAVMNPFLAMRQLSNGAQLLSKEFSPTTPSAPSPRAINSNGGVGAFEGPLPPPGAVPAQPAPGGPPAGSNQPGAVVPSYLNQPAPPPIKWSSDWRTAVQQLMDSAPSASSAPNASSTQGNFPLPGGSTPAPTSFKDLVKNVQGGQSTTSSFSYTPSPAVSKLSNADITNLMQNPKQLMSQMLASNGIDPQSRDARNYIDNADAYMYEAAVLAAGQGVSPSPQETLSWIDYVIQRDHAPADAALQQDAQVSHLAYQGLQRMLNTADPVGSVVAQLANNAEATSGYNGFGAPEYYYYDVIAPAMYAAGLGSQVQYAWDQIKRLAALWRNSGKSTDFVTFMAQSGYNPFLPFIQAGAR